MCLLPSMNEMERCWAVRVFLMLVSLLHRQAAPFAAMPPRLRRLRYHLKRLFFCSSRSAAHLVPNEWIPTPMVQVRAQRPVAVPRSCFAIADVSSAARPARNKAPAFAARFLLLCLGCRRTAGGLLRFVSLS